MNAYIERVIEDVKRRDPDQKLFIQTVEEVLRSVEPLVEKHPEYEKNAILERMVEPDRIVIFRVVWENEAGEYKVNRGFRVQFNSAIGPYKGGLRFSKNVTEDTVKFLGFEQSFKDSLTSLPMGGGKGGSDFDPVGKTDKEIMRFCQAFMTELYRHIGPNVDVPAGDLGVGGREIGFLFGQYKRIRDAYENGVLTGKGRSFGGSILRPEATGYGAVYYAEEVLKHDGLDIAGKTIACSGFGNVCWGICKKAAELGAKVVTLSGPDGYIYDPDGVATEEKINYLLEMRASNRNKVQDYADKFGVQFFPGQKPWGEVKVDMCMPAAVQNEVKMAEAQKMIEKGIPYYIEVGNMPTTNDALSYLVESGKITVAPSKAVNAGGVSVSGLEMSQNSERLSWDAEEVDKWLHTIMHNIYKNSVEAAEANGLGYDLVKGANIAGFMKIADAMLAQGIV